MSVDVVAADLRLRQFGYSFLRAERAQLVGGGQQLFRQGAHFVLPRPEPAVEYVGLRPQHLSRKVQPLVEGDDAVLSIELPAVLADESAQRLLLVPRCGRMSLEQIAQLTHSTIEPAG